MSQNHKGKKENNKGMSSFDQFMLSQEIKVHDRVAVKQITLNRKIRIAFWFLRGYIAVMIILVIIGFTHV